MKRIVFFRVMLLLSAVLSMGCNKTEDFLPERPDGSRSGSVCFRFEPDAAMPLVRSMDEDREYAVQDVNLWLFSPSLGIARHCYLADGREAVLELPVGNYDYYALANAGSDLGERAPEDMEAWALPLDPYADFQQGGRFMMEARGTFAATDGATVSVTLVRCAAKVELSLSVAPAFAGELTLQSVQVLSLPTTLHCFADNRAEDLSLLADYPAQDISGDFHGVFYLPENLAGVNTAITDPAMRSRANAPRSATCIRVQGVAQGKKVDYFIYPGANVTTDFNLRRNHHYRIETLITGLNTLDTRVSTTEVDLPAWNTQYFAGGTARSLLTLSCLNNSDNRFDLSYELLAGSGTVEIDGQPRLPGVPFRLLDGGSSCVAEIAYTQQEEGEAALRLLVTDRYGFTIERELSTTFVKDGPRVTFEQEGDTLCGYEFAFLGLHIAQPGYTGAYKVTVDGVARVCYDYDIPLTEFTLPGDGDYPLWVAPARLGPNPFRITVTDDEGRSAQITSVVFGRTASVQVSAGYTGGGLNQLTITVSASCPVGEDLDVTIAVYLAKLTMGGRETETERVTQILTIPAGDTGVSYAPKAGSNYMGYIAKSEVSIKSLSVTDSRDGLYRYEVVTP